ncbi:MarR family winged helix-turn-helix transcriptional regulator [Actinoplanes sp. NPDC051343]|uniref:MarR family winged helix-turn-helix transcriptional regulator n=1 Tax=Actinoplanes sp. NPDC051343 TaxID=3363906 RepID=UPI0037997A05
MTTRLSTMDALAQLSFLIHGTLSEVAGEHDLSVVQTRLLGVLRDREPTMQELGRFLGLDKSSISGLVDRAERRGLVRRIPSVEDRRAVRVSLTEDGRTLGGQVALAFEARIDAYVVGLPTAEREELTRLATRVVADDAQRRALPN